MYSVPRFCTRRDDSGGAVAARVHLGNVATFVDGNDVVIGRMEMDEPLGIGLDLLPRPGTIVITKILLPTHSMNE